MLSAIAIESLTKGSVIRLRRSLEGFGFNNDVHVNPGRNFFLPDPFENPVQQILPRKLQLWWQIAITSITFSLA